MGITGAWAVIGEGETVALAQLAADFYREHQRPMKIAIDEAVWRFNNLNQHEVKDIIEKSGGSCPHPLERLIFFRLMRLLRHNIQPYFVYDGPSRPWKRGSCGGLGFHDEEQRTCKRMFSKLRVPYYDAPGEAEAECAALEKEKIVDAVWTDDSDSFMFGAKTVIRTHRYKQDGKSRAKNSTTHVDVYRAQTIKEKTSLDEQGFVLLAMIAGGDYDTEGLGGCGANTGVMLVKKGLAKSLCEAQESDMGHWRFQLQRALPRKVTVPGDFPKWTTLKKYMNPTVSTSDQLVERQERFIGTYAKTLDEPDLRLFLKEKIDINTKDYLSHIVPWILMKKLNLTEKGKESEHDLHSIQLKPIRGSKILEDAHLLRKITFLPEKVTTANLTLQPGTEDWRKFLTKKNGSFDPHRRVECEMLVFILEKGVPCLFDLEAQNTSKKAYEAEAKARRAEERAEKAKQKVPSSNATTPSRTTASAKRKRINDDDTVMEDAQPKLAKQRKTKETNQKHRDRPLQSSEVQMSSSPIRLSRGLRIPPAIDFMDLEGFGTSLVNDSTASRTVQASIPSSSAGNRRSSGGETATTKKAAVVVDLLDSDEDEPSSVTGPVPPLRVASSSNSERGRHLGGELIGVRAGPPLLSPRREPSRNQNIAPTKPSSSAPVASSKAPQREESLPLPRVASTSSSQAPRPTQGIAKSSSHLITSPPTRSASSLPKQTPAKPSNPATQPSPPTLDEPSPEELRRRRLARFAQPVNKATQEEMNTTMQDLALTPKKAIENTWSFSNLPVRDGNEMEASSSAPQDIEVRTPRRIAGFVPTSSPLFVSSEPPRFVEERKVGKSMVIDLTDD